MQSVSFGFSPTPFQPKKAILFKSFASSSITPSIDEVHFGATAEGRIAKVTKKKANGLINGKTPAQLRAQRTYAEKIVTAIEKTKLVNDARKGKKGAESNHAVIEQQF